MQQLEGYQYMNTLDLNMGHYTIKLYPTGQDMMTIVTEFVKFRYNSLLMGMTALVNIFQAKVDKVISDIEGFKTYINDILVLSKDVFKNHMDQLRIIFGKLRASGLKVNAHKCSFWLKEIPYLGSVITREGIKPDPEKVKGIMDIGQPSTTTEALVLIGMVQYNRYMCTRRSHIFSLI